MLRIILLVLSLACICHASAGTMLMEYGFEDWTGSADTTPNYFSSNNDELCWMTHKANSEVVMSCGNNMPHNGRYYYHQNFCTGYDDCLGTYPSGDNSHIMLGYNGEFPPAPKESFRIRDQCIEETMTIRFWFRATGEYVHNVTDYMDFIVIESNEGSESAILRLRADSTRADIADYPYPDDVHRTYADYHNAFDMSINWMDGEWHSVVLVTTLLNSCCDAPNLRQTVWFDDWNMLNTPDHSVDVYLPIFTHYEYARLFVGWGDTPPNSDMGIDMDDIEVWMGIPDDYVPLPIDTPTPEPITMTKMPTEMPTEVPTPIEMPTLRDTPNTTINMTVIPIPSLTQTQTPYMTATPEETPVPLMYYDDGESAHTTTDTMMYHTPLPAKPSASTETMYGDIVYLLTALGIILGSAAMYVYKHLDDSKKK